MKSNKTTLSFLFFIIISLHSFSQKQDYIVTLKGDTVFGYLELHNSKPEQLVSDGQTYKIDVDNVECYFSKRGLGLVRRRALPDKKKFIFIPCLEAGKISLYEMHHDAITIDPYTHSSTRESSTYYAEKEYGILIEVWTDKSLLGFGNGNKKQRTAFALLIDDNTVIKEMFDKEKKYDDDIVLHYTDEYNKANSHP